MGKTRKIEPRTKRFAELHKELSEQKKMITHKELANILGFNTKRSITEILKERQNIDQDQWEKFKTHFEIKEKDPSPEAEVQKKIISPENKKGDIDYKEKHLKHLEKENKSKDKIIEKLSLAVDNITVVDGKVEHLVSTVNGLSSKVEVAESNIEVLREWLIDQFSKLKRESPQSVAASMGRKGEELYQKSKQHGTQTG